MPVGYITTLRGARINVFDPQPEDFDIEDIAHSLAQTARFRGRCKEFYSVAQHSVYVSYTVQPNKAKAALLHDTPEAYICDMPSPLKPKLPDYMALEEMLAGRMELAFGLPIGAFSDPDIKLIDKKLQSMEAAQLMDDPSTVFEWAGWPDETIFNLDRRFVPWPWKDAKRMFISRFNEIRLNMHDWTDGA